MAAGGSLLVEVITILPGDADDAAVDGSSRTAYAGQSYTGSEGHGYATAPFR